METIKELFKIGNGPSSSHTMGPGLATQQFKLKNPEAKRFKLTLYGSLAATGRGHLTDVVLINTLHPAETEIIWQPEIFLPLHPNGMDLEALDAHGDVTDTWRVYSVGGGTILDEQNFHGHYVSQYSMTNMKEILQWCDTEGRTFWEYVELSEGKEIWQYLHEVWVVMQEAIATGIETEGVLPGPLKLPRKSANYFVKANTMGTAVLGEFGRLFSYALAVSEQNASGNKIVIAPTCGSAGVLPAVLKFLQEKYNFSERRILNAIATAGLIGNLVKKNGSISGAEVGCQGEIGTACAMAAAAANQLWGGSPSQIEAAAEMGLEHHLGLTCDPIGGYVQIPCIERNAVAASRALECATFALFSDGSHRITFDTIVSTMLKTGRDLQGAYRETATGGLAKEWVDLYGML